jgi:hypothetical protein
MSPSTMGISQISAEVLRLLLRAITLRSDQLRMYSYTIKENQISLHISTAYTYSYL